MPASTILERHPVPMVPMPWFHGAISRFDAEKLLDRNQDGQFLLRTSQNTRGVYALAVRYVQCASAIDITVSVHGPTDVSREASELDICTLTLRPTV